MREDVFTCAQANRFIGSILLPEVIELVLPEAEAVTENSFSSLYEALRAAAEGNLVAREMAAMNVRTDMIERTSKSAEYTLVPLETNGQGETMQFGQTTKQVYGNTLLYSNDDPVMNQRFAAETRNGFRIENLNRQGLLDEFSFVAISEAENKAEAGFFTDTMSCVIQVTTVKDGQLTLESAFVAGIAAPGQSEHFTTTVVAMAAKLGADYSGKTPAEIINTPLLIHNSLLPHGVLDLVALYDEQAGGTFFGEAKPVQDYELYSAQCLERQKTFEPRVQEVVEKLIAEAHLIKAPEAATKRLNQLSGASMVERAVEDVKINPMVFGTVAARHVEMARLHAENGNVQDAQKSVQSAKKTETSSSCPTGAKLGADSESGSDNDTIGESKSSGKKIRMKCPFCGDPDQEGVECSPNQQIGRAHV